MHIRQLEAFRAVMTSGGVSRAAELLHVSQPAVSQLIYQLESYYDLELFQRVGNRLKPTREAQALLVEVEAMFAGIKRVGRVAASLREQHWGALSIASFPIIARNLLPRIVARYCRDRADVQFHLQSMRSRSLIDAVATQQMEIGLSFIPSDREETESEHLMALRAVCILPADHPLASKQTIHACDLANQPFISLGPHDQSRVLIDKIFDDRQIPRRLRIETGQSDAACAIVAEGLGVSVVDPISASENLGMGIVVRKFEPTVLFDIWLIRSRSASKSSLIDSFVAFLKEELALAAFHQLQG